MKQEMQTRTDPRTGKARGYIVTQLRPAQSLTELTAIREDDTTKAAEIIVKPAGTYAESRDLYGNVVSTFGYEFSGPVSGSDPHDAIGNDPVDFLDDYVVL